MKLDRIVGEGSALLGLLLLAGMAAFTIWALYVLLFT